MQLCGARGGGQAAARALYWVPNKGLSLMLVLESERERNAAIMLARRFACDQNVSCHPKFRKIVCNLEKCLRLWKKSQVYMILALGLMIISNTQCPLPNWGHSSMSSITLLSCQCRWHFWDQMMSCQWVRTPQVLLDENGGSGCSINQSIKAKGQKIPWFYNSMLSFSNRNCCWSIAKYWSHFLANFILCVSKVLSKANFAQKSFVKLWFIGALWVFFQIWNLWNLLPKIMLPINLISVLLKIWAGRKVLSLSLSLSLFLSHKVV